LILTAARELEVADMAVGEVDLDAGLWSIDGKRTKNKQPITLPLHPILIDDLRKIWPKHDAGPGWRLLGYKGNGLRGYSSRKRHIDALSGLNGWTWHDLRRTCRTNLSKLGIGSDVGEAT
jgi:integrase